MIVEHAITGLQGRTRTEVDSLHAWDELGPWYLVEWDDGLVCWTPVSSTRQPASTPSFA